MNRDDTLALIACLDRWRPEYAEWRSEQANNLAATHRSNAADEAGALIDSAARTLCGVSTAEAAAVVEGLETGLIKVPQSRTGYPIWGELINTIRLEAMADRQRLADQQRGEREQDRRLHCLACQDAGHVLVYNPKFVEWLRTREGIDQWRATQGRLPDRWYLDAKAEWYQKVRRGETSCVAEVPLACNCNCPNAKIYRDQLTAFKEGREKRAAYIGVWNHEKVCVVTFDPHADLTAWFENHAANESYQWNADPMQYAGNGGIE